MTRQWNSTATTSRLRDLGVTPVIKDAVLDYERQHGGSTATAGLATRVFNAIQQCGGVERVRMMTTRDLRRMKNVGRFTMQALIDLGLYKSTGELTSACGLRSCGDPKIEAASQEFLASAIEWRQHVDLHAVNQLTQTMLDKLDALVILLAGKDPNL